MVRPLSSLLFPHLQCVQCVFPKCPHSVVGTFENDGAYGLQGWIDPVPDNSQCYVAAGECCAGYWRACEGLCQGESSHPPAATDLLVLRPCSREPHRVTRQIRRSFASFFKALLVLGMLPTPYQGVGSHVQGELQRSCKMSVLVFHSACALPCVGAAGWEDCGLLRAEQPQEASLAQPLHGQRGGALIFLQTKESKYSFKSLLNLSEVCRSLGT